MTSVARLASLALACELHHIANWDKWASWFTQRLNQRWVVSPGLTFSRLFALLAVSGRLFVQSLGFCLQTWVSDEGPPRQFLKLVELTEGSVLLGRRHLDREPHTPASRLDDDPLHSGRTAASSGNHHTKIKKQQTVRPHLLLLQRHNQLASTDQSEQGGPSWCVQESHGGVCS